MNPQVDFYLLENPEQSAEVFCCKLAEKAFRQGHDIFIQVETDAELQSLDELLWTFKQESFLPHASCRTDAALAKQSPIRLGRKGDNQSAKDLLINLSEQIAEDFMQYQRVTEIVSSQEKNKALARTKFKAYQAQGIKPVHHKIS